MFALIQVFDHQLVLLIDIDLDHLAAWLQQLVEVLVGVDFERLRLTPCDYRERVVEQMLVSRRSAVSATSGNSSEASFR